MRTVLVPAIISLAGYSSGWPGRRLRQRPEFVTGTLEHPQRPPEPVVVTSAVRAQPPPATARLWRAARVPRLPRATAPILLALLGAAALAWRTVRARTSTRRR